MEEGRSISEKTQQKIVLELKPNYDISFLSYELTKNPNYSIILEKDKRFLSLNLLNTIEDLQNITLSPNDPLTKSLRRNPLYLPDEDSYPAFYWDKNFKLDQKIREIKTNLKKQDYWFVNISFQDLLNFKFGEREIIKKAIEDSSTIKSAGEKLNKTRGEINEAEDIFEYGLSQIKNVIRDQLNLIKLNQNEPTYLFEIELSNNFFNGLHKLIKTEQSCLLEIFKIEDVEIRLEIVEGNFLIRRSDLLAYDELKLIFQNQISGPRSFNRAIKKQLWAMGCADVEGFLEAYFSKMEPTPIEKRIQSAIVDILDEANDLLSIAEITTLIEKKIEEKPRKEMLLNTISELSSFDVYEFCQGKWGYGRKFAKKLENEDFKDIFFIIEIYFNQINTRHANSEYIAEYINKFPSIKRDQVRVFCIDDNLLQNINSYDVEYIMSQSKIYSQNYSKSKNGWYRGNASSKSISLIAIECIEKNGSPLFEDELRAQIKKIKHISENTFILKKNTSPDLIYIDEGLFGLRHRDLELNDDEENKLYNKMQASIDLKGKIVLSDIREIIEEYDLSNSITPRQLIWLTFTHDPKDFDYSGSGNFKITRINSHDVQIKFLLN